MYKTVQNPDIYLDNLKGTFCNVRYIHTCNLIMAVGVKTRCNVTKYS